MVPKVQHRSDLDHLDGVSVLVICETARESYGLNRSWNTPTASECCGAART